MALALRLVTAAALAVVAVVHAALAARYDLLGAQVTLGQLFRVQAAVALLAAGALLLRPARPLVVVAGAVALLSLLAVVGTTYVTLPAVGPFPRVHEPIWFPEKIIAAAAAALVTITSGISLFRRGALR